MSVRMWLICVRFTHRTRIVAMGFRLVRLKSSTAYSPFTCYYKGWNGIYVPLTVWFSQSSNFGHSNSPIRSSLSSYFTYVRICSRLHSCIIPTLLYITASKNRAERFGWGVKSASFNSMVYNRCLMVKYAANFHWSEQSWTRSFIDMIITYKLIWQKGIGYSEVIITL